MSYYNSRRVNERDVPESQHSIFIRGLPGTVTTDEIRDFFEEKFGSCNFDFVKVSPDRMKLYVAVRFDSKTAARECMEKYIDGQVLGHQVELSWFRDIRRYLSHCQKHGIRPGANLRHGSDRRDRDDMAHRGGDDERRQSRSKSRSRSYDSREHSHSRERSRSRSHQQSRSPSRGGSRSRSPQSRSRSPSSGGHSSPISEQQVAFGPNRRRFVEVKKEERMSISPPAPKKQKKAKKDKKKRRRHSPSSSRSPSPKIARGGRGSDEGEVSEGELPASERGSAAKNAALLVANRSSTVEITPPPVKRPEIKPPTPVKTMPSVILRNSSFTIDLDSNKVPQPKLKSSFYEQELVPTAQQNGSSSKSTSAGFLPSGQQNYQPPNEQPPKVEVDTYGYGPVKRKFERPASPPMDRRLKPDLDNAIAPGGQGGVDDNSPIVLGAALTNFKNIQRQILQDVRYKPPEKPNEKGGSLRLSSLSTSKSVESIREDKIAKLSPELRERVERKKLELELNYRTDCETYGFVAQKLISKDRSLEERLRLALLEAMKDLESEAMKQLDGYVDQVISLVCT